ncbi:MAG: hypothetical protein H6744_21555 [Deltaproteobacteria bacterium]|nr:hypothetical protein [Deltaproteobacteria bacterium]
MVSVQHDASISSFGERTAQVTLGRSASATRTLELPLRSVGRRGAVFATAEGFGDATHAWVEVTMPDGATIRPLVAVGAPGNGQTPVRFVHMFPAERRALEAYHAQLEQRRPGPLLAL